MSTPLGKYLDTLKANKTKISDLTHLKRQRVNDLANKENTKPSPLEFYKIIITVILLKNLPEKEFNNAVNSVFPDRPNLNFLNEFEHLSPENIFIQKHCLTQKRIEKDIGMSSGKISRLGSGDVKDLDAIELICFIEGLGYDLLKTFKEIFGDIKLVNHDKKKDLL